MLNLTEQKATLAELELLVAVRCRVLRAANQLPEKQFLFQKIRLLPQKDFR